VVVVTELLTVVCCIGAWLRVRQTDISCSRYGMVFKKKGLC